MDLCGSPEGERTVKVFGDPSGLGQPGQREVTHVSGATEVRTPWQLWVRSSMVSTIQIWLLTLGVVLVWHYFAATRAYQASWDPSTWRAFLAGWASAWLFIRTAYIIPVLLTIVAWVWHGQVLLRYRYGPEQRNRNWPPPYQAVDVREVGMLTAENADELLPQAEPRPTERVIRVEVPERSGARERRAFLPDVVGLPAFARASLNGQGFTVRTAARFRISRAQFEDMRDQFLERGWARWANPDYPAQGLELSPTGRAVLRYLARSDGA